MIDEILVEGKAFARIRPSIARIRPTTSKT